MEKPVFPVIIIDKAGSLSMCSTELELMTTRASVIFNRRIFNDRIVFDCQGFVWSFHMENKKIKAGFIRKLLAKTIYNPIISATVVWKRQGNYELETLKKILYEIIEKDDDVLTEYFGAETLKSAISQGNTFPELKSILNQYIFEVDERTLWDSKRRINY
jgi:hypothetical protein